MLGTRSISRSVALVGRDERWKGAEKTRPSGEVEWAAWRRPIIAKEIKTVANVTHWDIAEFLPVAAEAGLHVETESYPLEEANRALLELRAGHIRGAKVLVV